MKNEERTTILAAPQYINTLPLFYPFTANKLSLDAKLFFAPPSTINKHMIDGTVDCALMSTSAYLHHEQKLHRLYPFIIGAKEQVLSVKLFSKKKISDLDGQLIGITQESDTSVHLLKVLAKFFWNITPIFEKFEENTLNFEAFLLIGDSCLHFQKQGYYEYDLAHEWYRFTKTLFPFAVFVKKDESFDATPIEHALHQSLAWSYQNQKEIIASAQKKVPLSQKTLECYYNSLCYITTPLHEQGLTLFKSMIK